MTNNKNFTFDIDGIREFVQDFHLYSLVVLLEIVLRFLSFITRDETGHPKFRLLAPIFFCSIVPLFYIGLWIFDISVDEARDMGFMFPDPSTHCDVGADPCPTPSFHDKVFDGHILDIFRALNPRLIDWTAVSNCLGVILSLVSFSLIHVPINIPAFAVSSGISGEIDMNRELVAHGYSNAFSGLFGGLQNVMTYSFSILFMKSGGKGIASCLTIAFLTGVLFVCGPALAIMFPRCMAGTLLLHIGVDLFLEGVWGTFKALAPGMISEYPLTLSSALFQKRLCWQVRRGGILWHLAHHSGDDPARNDRCTCRWPRCGPFDVCCTINFIPGTHLSRHGCVHSTQQRVEPICSTMRNS